MRPPPPRTTLFPYTTLFRSVEGSVDWNEKIKAIQMATGLDDSMIIWRLENGGGPQKSVGKVRDRKSTRLNSSHVAISYAVFCLKKKKQKHNSQEDNRDIAEA